VSLVQRWEAKCSLTWRETTIVGAVVYDGTTRADLPAALGVSERTVQSYLTSLLDKLGCSAYGDIALKALAELNKKK
jgi:DNA-binding NarL/FixJ family response regulator